MVRDLFQVSHFLIRLISARESQNKILVSAEAPEPSMKKVRDTIPNTIATATNEPDREVEAFWISHYLH